MTPATIILWTVLLLALGGAITMGALASRKGKHWLVLWPVGFVTFAVLLAALGGLATAPTPVFVLAAALGLLALGIVAGSPLVVLVLELAGGQGTLGTHGGILVRDEAKAQPEREILRGGTTIGYLERLALIGAVFAGQFGALALIVAVKGLGRYSELENAAARERFIIGTLVSLIWAAACAAPIAL